MNSIWTVLGGWGIAPEILSPVFGPDSHYIDTNILMEEIIENGHLRQDWRDRCAALLRPHLNSSPLLAGWSTGALIALGCAPRLSISALIIISGTPSFCCTPDFPFGTSSRILRLMRKRLSTSKEAVLHEFRALCGLPPSSTFDIPWSAPTLIDGLHALEQITFATPPSLPCSPLFIHGTNDAIISPEGGEYFYNALGGTLVTLEAQHACFINNTEKCISIIDDYLEGRS